jgi:hypothetical protein
VRPDWEEGVSEFRRKHEVCVKLDERLRHGV